MILIDNLINGTGKPLINTAVTPADEITITAAADLGWEDNGGNWNTTGYSSNHLTAPGFLFGNIYSSFHYSYVPIAQSEVIASAIFAPYIVSDVGTAKAVKINAQKVADAALPDDASNKPSSMTSDFTTAVLELNNAALDLTGAQAWDVTAIIQEIVNQGDWAFGNSINLIISNDGGSGMNYAQIAMIGHASNNGAPLTIVR
jgi:hypothetical protein